MGMGMKSLKWEGIGTKNLFPHTSRLEWRLPLLLLNQLRGQLLQHYESANGQMTVTS